MKFTIVKDPIPFLIIDNTYNKEEEKLIFNEIEFFANKFQSADQTGSASDINGNLKKNNKGIFLDNVYSDRSFSNILNINRCLFNNEVKSNLSKCHYAYDLLGISNFDKTLVSYYDDGSNYFSHRDTSVISIITWLYKQPKNFSGGNFKFTDYNLDVELKNNRTIIFFSTY